METLSLEYPPRLSQELKLGPVAYGTWSGGRFMHFGEMLSEQDYCECVRLAYEHGIRTFVTADVYGKGQADSLLGRSLKGIPRDSYKLVGAIGHDFYQGVRKGNAGYPRFTDPTLRDTAAYEDFLLMACERSLERCLTDHFDLLLLHNPDERGYTSTSVWDGLAELRQQGMTKQLGIAPGPANGFTLDLIDCYENFGCLIDWAMVILNPLEPWPVGLGLEAALENGVKVMTRVLDHGGIFNDDLKPGHVFREGDHRCYRPNGWVERGCEFLDQIRAMADRHGLSLLQYAAAWNLSHPAVECVIPTFIQETGVDALAITEKIKNMANLTYMQLSPEEVETVSRLGDNTGCMPLKGASARHARSERCDEWPMRPELEKIAVRIGHELHW